MPSKCIREDFFMRTKIFVVLSILLLITSIFTPKIQAQEKASGSSASFHDLLAQQAQDNRVEVLKRYLNQQNSPLAPYASTFVAQADYYHIDWTLVAAISGVESTFGKEVPCINAWGFGIYGTQTLCFTSYDEGIRTVSKALREQYMDTWEETDIYSIGASYAASPAWANHVVYFMDQIHAFALQPENQPLPISL